MLWLLTLAVILYSQTPIHERKGEEFGERAPAADDSKNMKKSSRYILPLW